jgi:mannose-6-phosphate isomerase-like protein (cupin superfamily)
LELPGFSPELDDQDHALPARRTCNRGQAALARIHKIVKGTPEPCVTAGASGRSGGCVPLKWHTDEFFLVIDGQFDIALREPDGQERTAELSAGDIFVVPKGIEHKPSSPGGAVLLFEPSGTLNTGDRHEGDIPGYVDSTTGRDISG